MPQSKSIRELLLAPVRPAIMVHGGAGTRTDADPEPILAGVARAAQAGFDVLARGGSSLDAAEAAVVALEDDPLFNAGRGSCLTRDGTVEMDASVMDGRTLEAGAVADVRIVRNPVRLARRVMERSGHLLLVSDGAERFARETGERFELPEWFVTARQRERFAEAQARAAANPDEGRRGSGTVGAVAVDVHGHVAAATSTGGTPFKRPGRVGDTPIIGAGTWADDASAAVSCTGHGESVIRLVLGRWTADRVAAGRDPLESSQLATDLLKVRLGGDGGLIVAAPDGRLGWAHNTPRMSRAFMRAGMERPFCAVDADP